jgi:hypothetical protein
VEPREPYWALAGELLQAVSGLWPAEPLTRKDGEAAEALPKQWAEEIRALLSGAGTTKAREAPPIRYMATWRRLVEDEGAGDVTAQLQEPEVIAAYTAARERAVDYLTNEMRPVTVDELQGSRFLEPSVSQQLSANELIAALDPGRIVYGLRSGLVVPEAVELMRAVYPQVYGLLNQIIGAELLQQRARRASYRVPWRAEMALRAFLGSPVGTTSATDTPEPEQAAPIDFKPRSRRETETRVDELQASG